MSVSIDTVLKDCPFCGNPPKLENTATEAAISCATCRVLMRQRHARHCDEPAIACVVERWNKRQTLGDKLREKGFAEIPRDKRGPYIP